MMKKSGIVLKHFFDTRVEEAWPWFDSSGLISTSALRRVRRFPPGTNLPTAPVPWSPCCGRSCLATPRGPDREQEYAAAKITGHGGKTHLFLRLHVDMKVLMAIARYLVTFRKELLAYSPGEAGDPFRRKREPRPGPIQAGVL